MSQTPNQPVITQQQKIPPNLLVFEILQGLWVARCLHVAVKLDLADLLKDGPRNVEDLAQATDTHAPSLYRLLRALASTGVFVETEPNYFALTELSEVIRSDHSNTMAYLIKWLGHESQLRAWENLEYSLRTGKSAMEKTYGMNFWEYLNAHPAASKTFDLGMTGVSKMFQRPLVQAYDFSSFHTLVDIGGGYGSFLTTILSSYPQLQGVLFDRPSVIESAQKHIDPAFQDRMQLIAGDFFSTAPEGLDAYVLKDVLHDWNEEAKLKILQTCHRAMKPESKLLIIDRIIQPHGGSEALLMDILILVTSEGQEQTAEEWTRLLSATGFKLSRIISPGLPISIIESVPV